MCMKLTDCKYNVHIRHMLLLYANIFEYKLKRGIKQHSFVVVVIVGIVTFIEFERLDRLREHVHETDRL